VKEFFLTENFGSGSEALLWGVNLPTWIFHKGVLEGESVF
jgi:hypothetical protein